MHFVIIIIIIIIIIIVIIIIIIEKLNAKNQRFGVVMTPLLISK